VSGSGDPTLKPPAPVRLAEPALLFGARAARLRALAEGHAAPEWLRLLARVADGQRLAVRELRVPPAPPAPAAQEGPPLAPERLARDAAWRRMLGVVVSAARDPGLPPQTQEALRHLAEAGATQLEELADAVLAGDVPADRLACAPFVGAALQAYWGALAAQLDPARLPRGGATCPACGSPPVAAVVRGGDRLRYLACALCGAEWNSPRARCTLCERDGDVAYLHAEDDRGAKAETCGACRAYVKIFDEEQRLGVEAAADDAATVALDLRLGEDGWRRAAVNLYVAPGA
jgi:FdhE protein